MFGWLRKLLTFRIDVRDPCDFNPMGRARVERTAGNDPPLGTQLPGCVSYAEDAEPIPPAILSQSHHRRGYVIRPKHEHDCDKEREMRWGILFMSEAELRQRLNLPDDVRIAAVRVTHNSDHYDWGGVEIKLCGENSNLHEGREAGRISLVTFDKLQEPKL